MILEDCRREEELVGGIGITKNAFIKMKAHETSKNCL